MRNRGSCARSRCYLELASSYARAAELLSQAGGAEEASQPFFSLVAHAIELSLKAVIACADCDDERMITLGHDLSFCLRLAKQEGLSFVGSKEIEPIIEALSQPHQAQAFRYPMVLSWPTPDTDSALAALYAIQAQAREFAQ